MRVFLVSCTVAVVIAIGAAVVLHFVQKPVDVTYTTSAVRI